MSYQREHERRLKVGFVGVGSHCYRNLLPTTTFLPVEIVAMCDINLELANATARHYGVTRTYSTAAEMYQNEKLDAVFICVAPRLHPQLISEALDANLHVWCEKPPAMRAANVREMIDHRRDRIAVCGYKKAFMPATRKVVEILSQSAHQPLRSIKAEYVMSIPANGHEVLESGQFTNWLGNGCHPISCMVEVGGSVSAVSVHRGKHGGGACILHYASGAIGTLHMAQGSPRQTERYSFFGNGVEVMIDNCWRISMSRGVPFVYGKTTTYAPEGFDHGTIIWEPQNCLATLENKALFTQGFYNELRYFCDCVLDNRPAVTGSLEFALHMMEIYEAALLCADGQTVAVKSRLPGAS